MKCDIILGHLGTQYFPFLQLLEKPLPSLVLLAQVGKLNLEQAIKEKMSSHRRSKAEHCLFIIMCWKPNFHWIIHMEIGPTGPNYLKLIQED